LPNCSLSQLGSLRRLDPGFSLEEIAAQLATLPDRFPVLTKDWQPMSRVWDERIDQRIAELKKLKIDIVNCTCGLTNASARGR